jgi:hypothetical protein
MGYKKRICLICQKEYVPSTAHQRYCSYECGKQKERLLRIKEIFRLTKKEKTLRKRILKLKETGII